MELQEMERTLLEFSDKQIAVEVLDFLFEKGLLDEFVALMKHAYGRN